MKHTGEESPVATSSAAAKSTPLSSKISNEQKLDYLAKKVLESSGLLSTLQTKACIGGKEAHGVEKQLFHLKILERALDIQIQGDGCSGEPCDNGGSDNDDNNGKIQNSGNSNGPLFTCTDIHSSSLSVTDNNNNGILNYSGPPQYWSPPLATTSASIGDGNNNEKDIGSCSGSNKINNVEEERNIDNDYVPMMEDFAPFSKQFYLAVGRLLAFTYSQPITPNNNNANSSSTTTQKQKKQNEENNKDISQSEDVENYSLLRNVHTVRITRILSTLMELNVVGNGDTNIYRNKMSMHSTQRKRKLPSDNNHHNIKENSNDDEHIGDDHVSFLHLLLHHTEQNSLLPIQCQDGEELISPSLPTPSSPHHKIPLIQSIFKYYSSLSQLESHLYFIVRMHRLKATSISVNNMDIKVRHMKLTQQIQEKLEDEFKSHISSLEYIIGTVYCISDVMLRKKIRLRIGNLLHSFVVSCSAGGRGGNLIMSGGSMGVENTNAAGIDSMLKILLRLLKGIALEERANDVINSNESPKGGEENNTSGDNNAMSVKLKDSHHHLLLNVLLPLHKPSGMVLWRDQKPILSLYHESLVQCIGSIVQLDTSLIGKVIQYILHPDVWPLEGSNNGSVKGNNSSKMANTPKVILLLHEIDTLIGLLNMKESQIHKNGLEESSTQFDILPAIFVSLILRLASCISSDNSRTSERALEFFKNDNFKRLVKLHMSQVMSPLLRALCRIDTGMEVPWNPTVQKMTSLVLRELQAFDEVQFKISCGEILFRQNDSDDLKRKPIEGKSSGSAIIQSHDESPTADMISLRKSMGSWKPPTKSSAAPSISMPPPKAKQPLIAKQSRVAPPLTITGVAPWKVKAHTKKVSSSSQPPLTVTGVAPWSVRSSLSNGKKLSSFPKSPQNTPLPQKKGPIENRNNIPLDSQKDGTMSLPTRNKDVDNNLEAFARVQAYIDKLKQSRSDEEENTDGISSWAKSQMSESPLLLPSLKFHDLVFGQVLGTGAFSTVRYARQIMKGKTRSYWPEFAIKIVSTQKIEELGYEKSINREIAILRMLSHPGISRLVSSFRFRDGAYLVLEYASGGDLHTLLKANGSLNQESTRFVIGELVAALHSIHELDLVYVDLKPENVLVTESGHCKLTDFGGCRPLTDKSKEIVMKAGQNLVRNLRDGDWRISNDTSKDFDPGYEENNVDEITEGDFDDDLRIEGTTAYLPPEIILGSYPSLGTDAWALGCVFYQCLAGRPPLLEASESSTRQRIVSFVIGDDSLPSKEDEFFSLRGGGSDDGAAFSDDSKDLIKRLLSRNPADRPNMIATSEHSFFDGTDVFNLYKETSCRLDAGRIAPQPDAQWTRRQFSSIWAPQPRAYKITSEHDSLLDKNVDGPIPEGAESGGFFLATRSDCNKRPILTGIQESSTN